jgi:hypothetical protein
MLITCDLFVIYLNLNYCLLKTNHRKGNTLAMTARTSKCPYTFVYLFELMQLFCMPLGILSQAFQLSACYFAYMSSYMTTSVSHLIYNLTHCTRVFSCHLLQLLTLVPWVSFSSCSLLPLSTHNSRALSSHPGCLYIFHSSHPQLCHVRAW